MLLAMRKERMKIIKEMKSFIPSKEIKKDKKIVYFGVLRGDENKFSPLLNSLKLNLFCESFTTIKI